VLNELVRYGPSEVIANTAAGGHPEIRRMLTERIDCLLQVSDDCFKPEKTGLCFFSISEKMRKTGISATLML
jgi:hypothetical protein